MSHSVPGDEQSEERVTGEEARLHRVLSCLDDESMAFTQVRGRATGRLGTEQQYYLAALQKAVEARAGGEGQRKKYCKNSWIWRQWARP